jgi:hypothetical protein
MFTRPVQEMFSKILTPECRGSIHAGDVQPETRVLKNLPDDQNSATAESEFWADFLPSQVGRIPPISRGKKSPGFFNLA